MKEHIIQKLMIGDVDVDSKTRLSIEIKERAEALNTRLAILCGRMSQQLADMDITLANANRTMATIKHNIEERNKLNV